MERAVVKEMTYDEFVNDEMANFAVISCTELMGEAAKHIPDSVRDKYPEIPWRDIAGMRDKVIHFYFGCSIMVWIQMQSGTQ